MSSGVVGRYPTFTKSRTLSSLRSPSSGQDIVFGLDGSERVSQRRVSLPSQPFVPKSSSYKWDEAQKWISSPMGKVKQPGPPPPAAAAAAGSHRSRHSRSVVVREVVFEELSVNNRLDKRKLAGAATVTAVNLSQHNPSSKALQPTTSYASPPTTGKSIFLRDMGTEMTPWPSHQPSRTGTPVRSSDTMVPVASPAPSESAESVREKDLQMTTERDIMMLGMKLREIKVAAWTGRKAEVKDDSSPDVQVKDVADIHADALEDAEKSKYMTRFKREEARIQAWEDHLKDKAEAELMKIEYKVERMRSHAHGRVRSKLAEAKEKADKKHAVAEAERDRQAERTARKAESIRTTGSIPSPCYCWSCCS